MTEFRVFHHKTTQELIVLVEICLKEEDRTKLVHEVNPRLLFDHTIHAGLPSDRGNPGGEGNGGH